jgi:alpha-L-rhamnosidase
MVKPLRLIPILLLAQIAPAYAAMKPIHLRCEYLTNPLGLDTRQPRLSWILESKERAEFQSAYQILVASSEDQLRANKGDLWDSGKVASDQTAQIVYKGLPLKTGQRCWWKVRVWGKDETPSRYSAPASWEMGLLQPEDWHGAWIARTDKTDPAPAPLLRRAFALKEKVKQARIYLCGLGYYELRLNGQKVGDHHLDPGYTRYDKRALYVTYDVTALLKSGKNALGVMLGTGWYNVHTKAVWDFHQAPWRAAPRLRLEMRLTYNDGREEHIATDTQWKTSAGPIIFDSIYGGETYDARLEKPGWDTPDYDDSTWQTAQVVEGPKGVLAAQQHPPIRITTTLTPVKLTEPKPGVFVYDLGQNFAGHAQISLEGPAGTTVQLRYGERLHPDGTLDNSQLDVHLRDEPRRFQTDQYILKGQGHETWEARFVYHGFQYVEVTGFPGKPTLANLKGRVVHTDLPRAGEFECSNTMFNRIYKAGLWSYLSNLQGIPTDCPHREKNGWTGDAHLAAEQAMLNFDPAAVYTKWVQDLGDEQRPTGELPGIVPTSGWGYIWGNGPAWDSAFLLIPWYMYRYYGDVGILERHYEGMRRYVDYLTSKAQDGIVSIGLGDWIPVETETPVAVTSTGYYYIDALIVAQAAQLIGKKDDAKKYSDLAAQIKRDFNAKFYDEKTGLYANGSQTALACALYQGLFTPENRILVLKNLIAAIEKRNNHIDTGILGAKYVLNALRQHGRPDLAYAIAAQKDQPGWGWWLEQGATTLWEAWKGTDSRNHIMFGDILAWFTKTLAGIDSEQNEPGFRRFILRPHLLGDLTFARATYDSIRGRIVSDWKIEGSNLTYKVQIPPNTQALVYVPATDIAKVTESGKPIPKEEGSPILFRQIIAGYAELLVASGHYTFVSKNFKQP